MDKNELHHMAVVAFEFRRWLESVITRKRNSHIRGYIRIPDNYQHKPAN
jgi:hypothetical protein